MRRSTSMVQPILTCLPNLDISESHKIDGGISSLDSTNILLNGRYVNFDQQSCRRQAISNRFDSTGKSLLFHDTQSTTDVNRFESDKLSPSAAVNGKSSLNRHIVDCHINNNNNSSKLIDYSTPKTTAFQSLANPTDSFILNNKLTAAEHSNDTNRTILMKNNRKQAVDCSLSPSNIAQVIKAKIINRNDTKELASAMSENSFDRETKLNQIQTKSNTAVISHNRNSSTSKLTKSSTTTTTTTTTMTTTINTSIRSNSTHTKCSEVLIVKNSTSRKLGGFVDKIANLTKYDPVSHLGRHLIKHTNSHGTPTSTHANQNIITNNASSCGESSTTSKSCSSTPSSVAVSMNSSAKSSISNLSSTGGMSCINSIPYVDHQQPANQTIIQPNIKSSDNNHLSRNGSHLHNDQSLHLAQSSNNLCRPTINISEQTTQYGSQSTLRCDSKNEELSKDIRQSVNSVSIFQKSSTYNNLIEYHKNCTNTTQANNSFNCNMDQEKANPSKFHYSASANNISCSNNNIESGQNIALELEQNKKKKSSIAKSFLSVDPTNSSKYLRKKAKKEAKKAKSRHLENVEQLRMLVDYLHHNRKPLSLSLEAEEIELARSFKLNSKLCDDCLSSSEYGVTHLPVVSTIVASDQDDGEQQMPTRSTNEFTDIIRCHRCRKQIERPESTISHFSDSAITNSDQDSNDENKAEDSRFLEIAKPKEQTVSIWPNKRYRNTDDILDKFLAKQKGHIVARAARRGSVFQPKLLFVSFKKDCRLEDISKFAKCLPMRSWTSELFLTSHESNQLLDPAVKRELLTNYSYEDFRHVLTPELSHLNNNVESMLAMNDMRRKSFNAVNVRKQRIRFRKLSQVGTDKMWDVDRLQQKNRKNYQERLQVIRKAPNGSSACSNSSGLNLDDKHLEAYDSMIDAVGTDSADYEGSDSQINDDYDDVSRVNHNLESIDAFLLAKEMTLISRDLILSIDHIELTRILLEPHLVDTKNCPNIVILLDFDRRIYHLLITEIVSRSNIEERVEIIVKLIDVAVILNGLKNYFSLNSVISALHSPPIARLNSTWTSLKHRHINKYDSLVKLSNQVMITYDLTELDETPISDDKEKEMNLRQMIDNCCIPQFELIVNQMKKSILDCMCTKVNQFPTQSTPLSSNQIKSENSTINHSNCRASRIGTWTNPQNLAVWIDHEINSLINELETKKAQQESKTKRRSTKWLRGRRNSSHGNNTVVKNNESSVSVITKSLSDASLAPTSNEIITNGSLWSRLLSKKRKIKSNPSKEALSGQSINQEESRKSSVSDKSSVAGFNHNSKITVSVSDLTTPSKLDAHQPDISIDSNSVRCVGSIRKPTFDTTMQLTPLNTNTQMEFSNLSKSISRSESYHYLLSSISVDNKKFIMNLIHTWLLELHAKMDSTLADFQNSYKPSCEAREFLLMQAYRSLKECLVLSLQHEPLSKDKIPLTENVLIDGMSMKNAIHIVESTRL